MMRRVVPALDQAALGILPVELVIFDRYRVILFQNEELCDLQEITISHLDSGTNKARANIFVDPLTVDEDSFSVLPSLQALLQVGKI